VHLVGCTIATCFSDSSYESTAQSETSQIFKEDRLMVHV